MPNQQSPAFRSVAQFRAANAPPRRSRPRVMIKGAPPSPPRMTLDGLGHTAYHHVGVDGIADVLWSPTARVIGTFAGAFHGYRRNKSVGWAVLWALLGGASPVITAGVALAQGFGKPKGGR